MRGSERPADTPRRILIIKPSSLGDIVHALPVLAALRRRFPAAHIAWMVNTQFAPLLDGIAELDEIIPFDRRGYGRMHRSRGMFVGFWRFALGLRRRRFDLVVDLQGLFRSGFLAWFSGARRRVGFAGTREMASGFYTQRVNCPADVTHAVDRNRRVAAAVVGTAVAAEFPLSVRVEEQTRARALVAEVAGRRVERFVAVIPGARWETKQWPAEKFAAVIDLLHARGGPPAVLLGSPDEAATVERVSAATEAPTVNLVGRTTLRELAAVLSCSAAVVCNDSGPMHIAAALDVPTVALFGPTDPARCGPYSPAARVVRTGVACSPCYISRLAACPYELRCLRELDAGQVVDAVHGLGRRAAGGQTCAGRAPESPTASPHVR